MEEDIERIRKQIESFMEKYNCYVRVETTAYGTKADGRLAVARARIIINS